MSSLQKWGRLEGRLVVAAALLLAGSTPVQAQSEHVPGRILVKFKSDVSAPQGRAALGRFGARAQEVIPGTGVQVVSLPGNADENAYLNAFKGLREVEFAEFDEIVEPDDVTPNDPFYGSQWFLPRISAPQAWGTTTGQAGVIIAIVDTGVDGTHPDLSGKLVAGWNTYNNNADSNDVYGHGTKVAGTAAAASNNGLGVAGVCWNCWIMPVRASAVDGSASYSALAAGITWAADHGARVANVSYMVTNSSAVSAAANYMKSKGGVVTISAGNYATFDPTADNPNVLTISATDENDLLYSWSNKGNNVDLAAPGCVYTTTRWGGYGSTCGTSFSAPTVAGVAGLVLSQNPNLSGDELTARLKQSGDDIGVAGFDTNFGWGRINAAKAVTPTSGGGGSDTQAPSVAITSPASSATVSSTVTIQASANDNVGVASVSFYVDGALLGTDTSAPFSWQWNSSAASNGGHMIAAAARDAAGNVANSSAPVTVDNAAPPNPTADEQAPTISILSPSNGSSIGNSVNVLVSASDNTGVVKVELYVDGKLTAISTAAPFTTKWNAKPKSVARGAHSLQVRAYDAAGNIGYSGVTTVYK